MEDGEGEDEDEVLGEEAEVGEQGREADVEREEEKIYRIVFSFDKS